MARSSVLLSGSKRQDGSSGSPPVRSAKVTLPGTPTAQAQEIRPAIEALQAPLSSGDLDLDAFLDQIAQGALKLTGAAGAAVAIRVNNS
jgi:hypothetical protein